MYLTRIDLVGFKSFAHKTNLRFTEGLTAIVGPNGCGKTNVIDAIRWVLGEQKASVLRTDGMEQVIFNGSKNRKPLGMSEVSLTIENNKKILPIEFSEVMITRRLFRDGTSQYLLNNNLCRLRDITDLFMDTGMGADAYSVIELKMIETILSDKAYERRNLFEEAAGVTRYKSRRKEAQRKLESVQRDLSRVNDILREVQKNVGSLGRQAEKAKLYQDVSLRGKELEKEVFSRDYFVDKSTLEQLSLELQTARVRKIETENRAEESEIKLSALTQKQRSCEQDFYSAQEQEQHVNRLLATLHQTLAVTTERKISLERSLERLEHEQEESQSAQLSSEEVRSQKLQQLTLTEELLAKAQDDFQLNQSLQKDLRATLEQLRSDVRANNDQQLSILQRYNTEVSKVERLGAQTESLRRRIDDSQLGIQKTDGELTVLLETIDLEESKRGELADAVKIEEDRLHSAQDRQQILRAKIDEHQQELSQLRSSLSHTKASLEFLNGLVDTNESSTFLRETNEWSPSSSKSTLAELLSVDKKLKVAIEGALGEAARYFVVSTKDEALSAFAALRTYEKGKATFLVRELLPSVSAPDTAATGDGVIGFASELIRSDDQLLSAARLLFGKTLVVENLDIAFRVIREGISDRAVTLSGEVVTINGIVRGGAQSKTEGLQVGRLERIDELKQEVHSQEEAISQREKDLQGERTEYAGINLREFSESIRFAESKRATHERTISQLHFRRDSLRVTNEQLSVSIRNLSEEADVIDENIATLREHLSTIEEAKQAAQAEFELQTSQLKKAELEFSSAELTTRRAEMTALEIRNDARAFSNEIQRLTNERSNLERRIEDRITESREVNKSLGELLSSLSTTEQEIALVAEQNENSKVRTMNCKETLDEVSRELHAFSEIARSQRYTHEENVAVVHNLEVRESEVRARLSGSEMRSIELSIDLDDLEESPTDVPIELVREELTEVRRKLSTIGNVNFLALEEFEKESERFNFLRTQLNDLNESEKILNETITEINGTAQDMFVSTFEKIRLNFIRLFKVLFNEDDTADLILESGDPLESHIDIIAKPRGKRPHSIEMLSGGEKTLTAIALLFAIYLVKPSPFCILDEVDAPLDDANIDRYLRLIRTFSNDTQFIMITHNKKTMEAADTLYGVTMEEPGVSKLVSARMTQEGENSEKEEIRSAA